jgi:hypothetical protein
MNRLQLVNAMFKGTLITIPMTDGYGCFRGVVNGMTKEDGSGHSWIVLLTVDTPHAIINHKLHMRTTPGSYSCRLIGE